MIQSSVDFSTVTELPGVGAHPMQLRAMHTRYHFASQYCGGSDVLEVACGSGMGLGYLAEQAKSVVGTDIDPTCLSYAEETYRGRPDISVARADAQALPFEDDSFDLVLLFEAIYYLPSAAEFLSEARRVLRRGGRLLIVTVNRQWTGFNPSPHSQQYYSLQELGQILEDQGFQSQFHLGFQDRQATALDGIKRTIRKTAVRMNLIPKTMRGKQSLKRLFYGKLEPIARELVPGAVATEPLVSADSIGPSIDRFQVIYVASQWSDPSQ